MSRGQETLHVYPRQGKYLLVLENKKTNIIKMLCDISGRYENADDFLFDSVLIAPPERIIIHEYMSFANKRLLELLSYLFFEIIEYC